MTEKPEPVSAWAVVGDDWRDQFNCYALFHSESLAAKKATAIRQIHQRQVRVIHVTITAKDE